MSTAWLYLLNALIYLLIFFFVLRFKGRMGEPYQWFSASLLLGTAAAAFLFFSRLAGDSLISLSFWIAGSCFTSAHILAIFFFARSFTVRNDFFLLIWSIPFLFNLAFYMVAGGRISVHSQGIWRYDLSNHAMIFPTLVMAFYTVFSLYYLFRLYLDLRREGEVIFQRACGVLLAAFLIMFLGNAFGPPLRHFVSYQIPLSEISVTVGALMIALDLSWMGIKTRKP